MNYEIKLIESQIMGANCYIIKTSNNKNILIDPCVSYDTLLKNHIENIDCILITHGHVDHIFYLKQLVEKYNCKIYLSKQCLDKVYDDHLNLSFLFKTPLKIQKNSFIYELIYDNYNILIDNLIIKCIYTPGHTNCSMCFLIENDLFTGDTLFDRSVGRTDFPTGNSLELHNSLNKIINLNYNFTIYPGHDSISTIEEQKKYNYYLK